MQLYHLVSNVWKFSFRPKYEEGGNMPSESIFTFNLNGSMDFHGNSYGGHPTLSWAFSDNTFFVYRIYL
jgi:hypothetical protein